MVDPRLTNLKSDLFKGKDVLDIGCNSGFFSIDLALLYAPNSLLGIDIDPSLIRKAKNHLYLKASMFKNNELDYFPQSCPREHGTLPYQTFDTAFELKTSIKFRCSDFIQEPLHPDIKYDVVMAMSITKWIHLEYGDAGIRLFFTKCYQSLRNGGVFILEPQAFETYKKKIKLDKGLQETYASLSLRPNDFQTILEETGFKLLYSTGEDASSGFKRPIYIYQK